MVRDSESGGNRFAVNRFGGPGGPGRLRGGRLRRVAPFGERLQGLLSDPALYRLATLSYNLAQVKKTRPADARA